MVAKNRWSSVASGATSAALLVVYKCYAKVGFTNVTVKPDYIFTSDDI